MAQIWRSDAPFDTYAGLGPADRPFAGPPRPPSRSNSRGSNAHHEAAVTWSAEEDAKLEELVRLHTHAQTLKPVWATIAEAMGRTGASCRNHYLRMRTAVRSGAARPRAAHHGAPEAEEEPPPKSAKIANDELLVAHELSALFHSEPSPMTAAAPRHRAGAPTPFPRRARRRQGGHRGDGGGGRRRQQPADRADRRRQQPADPERRIRRRRRRRRHRRRRRRPRRRHPLRRLRPRREADLVEDDGACSRFRGRRRRRRVAGTERLDSDLLLGACSTAPRSGGGGPPRTRCYTRTKCAAPRSPSSASLARSVARGAGRGGGRAAALLSRALVRAAARPRSPPPHRRAERPSAALRLPESDAPQYGAGVRPQVLDSATYAIFARAPAEAAGDAAFDGRARARPPSRPRLRPAERRRRSRRPRRSTRRCARNCWRTATPRAAGRRSPTTKATRRREPPPRRSRSVCA